jgi:phenylacetate-CoA ligase
MTFLSIKYLSEAPIPHFFHFLATDTFVEAVDGCLCIIRWQVIPLVRYILYDKVTLYSWKELKQAVLSSKHLDSQNEALRHVLSEASLELPDLLVQVEQTNV